MALKSLFNCSPPSLPPSPALLPQKPLSSNLLPFFSRSSKSRLSISQSPTPIFLPLLDEPLRESDEVEDEEESVEHDGYEEEQVQDEGATDPILRFFKARTDTQDSGYEGRLRLQKNRRTSWRIADAAETGNFKPDELEEVELEPIESSSLDPGLEREGIVGEILRIARNLPQNTTLGEVLGPYSGRVGEKECIELLLAMGDVAWALNCLYLLEWMGLQEPSLVTPRAYSIVFPVLGRARMGDQLMILIKNLPAGRQFRDLRVYNAAISGLSSCGRYDDAWRVYGMMEGENIHPDHVTCSILITVMRKTGKSAKDAWEFFERMNQQGVEWSQEVFGAIIKSFCHEGLKKEALIIQSEMEKKGIKSNSIIYNTLMDGFSKSNQIEEAEGLFLEMKQKGLKPTVATYNILMDAYSRRMQPEIIEELMKEMQDLGLDPNVKSYTCLISAYGKQRKMSDKAADAFLRMKKVGIKPTSHSYTALIHAYSLGGWHEKADFAFENMKREGIKPSIETYTALLDAFRRAGNTQKLMEIWKTMMCDKIKGTRVTFNILLDGLAKQGQYVEARDVIFEFGKLGLVPTVLTYNMLLNAYARGGQHSKLPQLLKEMAALELKPDSVTYSTMIYAYVRVRDFSRAFYYHKQMVNNRQVPDARSYEKLRAILEAKAKTKNRRDRSAILGIINSNMGVVKPKKGKKDEFWKNKKKRSQTARVAYVEENDEP